VETMWEGKRQQRGITCVRDLKEHEPYVWERLVKAEVYKDDQDCLPCIALETLGDDAFPEGLFKGTDLDTDVKYFFQVILEEETYKGGDSQLIKFIKAPITAVRSFVSQMFDEDICGQDLFESKGVFSKWTKPGKGEKWDVRVISSKKLWTSDWQGKLLDPEIIIPSVHSDAD
ncbi:unnamed protein product, partial [marine sediment metagenome]